MVVWGVFSKTVVKAVRTALEATSKPPLNPYRWQLLPSPKAAVGWGRAAPQGADASFAQSKLLPTSSLPGFVKKPLTALH
jgi:hypothetical protein